MDTAIKAEWYDLSDEDRAPFLNWLHGEHCPRLQARPGHIWVGHYDRAPRRPQVAGGHQVVHTDDPNVPTGSQYLLLTAVATPDVFFDPNVSTKVDVATQKWLDRRIGYRFAIFIEETRVNGPAWFRYLQGHGAPPAMQLGNFRTRSEEDDLELAFWYRQQRLPQVTATRGCIGARKLISVVGWPKHGILYEFTGMDADEYNFEKRFVEAPVETEWKGRHVLDMAVHAPHGAHAGRRLWPAV